MRWFASAAGCAPVFARPEPSKWKGEWNDEHRSGKRSANIIICGVGGQGNILASELTGFRPGGKRLLHHCGRDLRSFPAGRFSDEAMYVYPASSSMALSFPAGKLISSSASKPIETLRVAREYANKETQIVFDSRPNYHHWEY
jgi:hypothetical protein